MPNGRSGGFVIEKTALKQVIKTLPVGTVVATVIAHDSRLRPADAQEVARLVEECPSDRIAVEEQDHNFYIVHLSNQPELLWLSVKSDTALFLELRQQHERWATDHPDWKGWMAF